MLLKNPTTFKLAIEYKGSQYELGPEAEASFPNDVATFWSTEIHQFLVASPDKPKEVAKPAEVVEVVEAPVVSEDVKTDEVKADEVAAAPVKTKTK